MGKERFHLVDADAAESGVHWLCIWSKEGDCNKEVARQVSRTGSLFLSPCIWMYRVRTTRQ